MSTVTQVFAPNEPDEPALLPKEGALLYVMVSSFQVVLLTEWTLSPSEELLVAHSRNVARVIAPLTPWTLKRKYAWRMGEASACSSVNVP